MTRHLIRPQSDARDSSETVRLAARGLSPELQQEARRRLELACLFLAATWGFVLALTVALREAGWDVIARPGAHALVGVAMIAVSAAVAVTAGRTWLSPAGLVRLGLAYEVVFAVGISLSDNLGPLAQDRPLETISWLCVLIVMFPLVVPATPTQTFVASLVAASTWPLGYWIVHRAGDAPLPAAAAALNFLENYLAAVLALVPTAIWQRLRSAEQKAREMGSYELTERIDRGGMGEVWRARHRLLARPAAVKLIRPDRLGLGRGEVADALVRRFEREAQATAALHSPHTIDLYDFGVTREGTFYYVMEMLEGLDLDHLVRRFGPVEASRVAHLLLQACDSLADAHDAGLVHRDVKPANLFVCRRGRSQDFVKVLDFGLVKSSWTAEPADASLTGAGLVAGTPAYMAPETVRGDADADGRVDLYALGCVGYWLVTGQRVFEGEGAMQLAMHHLNTPVVPPSRRTELPVPAALEEILLWCLEKDPARRPSSADAMGARLAATGLAAQWTPERARRWWDAHLPGSTGPDPLAIPAGGPS